MPKKVSGTFLCWSNKLTSLEGAPNEVGGDFNCCNNKLITLKGKPEKIGGEFKIDEDVLAKVAIIDNLLEEKENG